MKTAIIQTTRQDKQQGQQKHLNPKNNINFFLKKKLITSLLLISTSSGKTWYQSLSRQKSKTSTLKKRLQIISRMKTIRYQLKPLYSFTFIHTSI